MSLLDTLDPALRPWAQKLFDICVAARVNPRITSAFRSYATQKALYDAFVQGKSRYPAAPPGRSAHEYGLAFDMVVDGAVNQSDCGVVWTSWNGKYGGEEDPIHFEFPGFTPPPGPPQSPVEVAPVVRVYTPSTFLVKARQLADAIAPAVFAELGYIVDTAAISRAIGDLIPATPDTEQALRTLDWGLQNPEQFFGAEWDLMRTILLSYF